MCFIRIEDGSNNRDGKPKAEPALFVMPSAKRGCIVRKIGNGGKLVRVYNVIVVDGDARLASMALTEGVHHGLVPAEDATNRSKMRAYFAANLNQRPDRVLVTYNNMGDIVTLKPVLDEDGCPLLLPSRLREYSEERSEDLEALNAAAQSTANDLRAAATSFTKDLRALNTAAPSNIKDLRALKTAVPSNGTVNNLGAAAPNAVTKDLRALNAAAPSVMKDLRALKTAVPSNDEDLGLLNAAVPSTTPVTKLTQLWAHNVGDDK